MRRGQVPCSAPLCASPAVRSVDRRYWCAAHASFVERLAASIDANGTILDRLARDGDCLACAGTEHGCGRHRDGRP